MSLVLNGPCGEVLVGNLQRKIDYYLSKRHLKALRTVHLISQKDLGYTPGSHLLVKCL